MKLHFKGHPIHVILAHFPAALFPTGVIFDFLARFWRESDLTIAAFYCLFAGVISGIAVVIAGVVDLYGLYERDDQESLKKAWIHGAFNSAVFFTFAVIVFEKFKAYPSFGETPAAILIVEGVAILLLIVGNFFGGEVYQMIIRRQVKK